MKQKDQGKIVIINLYIDDLIYTRSGEKMFKKFKISMQNKFSMTDLGKMIYFLGVEVRKLIYGIFIHRQKNTK